MTSLLFLLLALVVLVQVVVLGMAASRRNSSGAQTSGPVPPAVSELHTVRFLRLPFTTFFKLSVLLAAVTGFVTGVFFSIAGICGARVTVNFFSINLRGEEAIIAAPFLCPVLGALCAFVLSLPAWALTNWLLRRTRGIDVTGTIANLPEA